MKILLVQPKKPAKAVGGEDFSIFEPLALEYLAAGVASDHDVRIIDMRLGHDLEAHLCDFEPDLVGITAYTVHVNTVKALCRQVKSFHPDIRTVVGGHHATVRPQDFDTPHIDAIIVGEGVFAFRDFVRGLERKQELAAPGAVCAEKGALVIRSDEAASDLDVLPLPRRDLTAASREAYFSEWMRPLASLRTSKGCRFRCSFCALWKLTGGRYLTRKPERIVEELGGIAEPYVFFADDESLLDADRMEAVADLIRRAGLRKRFFLYGRSDTIARHPDLIETWKAIGLERVFVGLEFFRDADLKRIRKGSTASENAAAIQILKMLDIEIWPMFMVRPDFTQADFQDLREYCRAMAFDFIGFPVLTPLPGTALAEAVRNALVATDYDFYDFFHTLLPTRLERKVFYRELVGLYRHARPLGSQLNLLRKYRLREMPGLLRSYREFLNRLGTLDKDYAVASAGPMS